MKIVTILLLFLLTTGLLSAQGKGKGLDKKAEMQEAKEMKQQGKDKAEEMKQQGKDKAEEMKQQGKDKAEEVKQQGKDKAEEVKQQGKDKAKEMKQQGKAEAKEMKQQGKAEAKEMKQQGKVDKAQGNAYGKNKGGLSGKEFGQARAAEARAKNKDKKQTAQISITKGEDTVKKASDKIAAAKDKLDTDLKQKVINQDVYDATMEKIKLVEKKAAQLQEVVNKGKELFSK